MAAREPLYQYRRLHGGLLRADVHGASPLCAGEHGGAVQAEGGRPLVSPQARTYFTTERYLKSAC